MAPACAFFNSIKSMREGAVELSFEENPEKGLPHITIDIDAEGRGPMTMRSFENLDLRNKEAVERALIFALAGAVADFRSRYRGLTGAVDEIDIN